jgi:hypothetical protein
LGGADGGHQDEGEQRAQRTKPGEGHLADSR